MAKKRVRKKMTERKAPDKRTPSRPIGNVETEGRVDYAWPSFPAPVLAALREHFDAFFIVAFNEQGEQVCAALCPTDLHRQAIRSCITDAHHITKTGFISGDDGDEEEESWEED